MIINIMKSLALVGIPYYQTDISYHNDNKDSYLSDFLKKKSKDINK